MSQQPRSSDPLPIDEHTVNPLILGLASMIALRAIAKAKSTADKCVLGVALAGPSIVLLGEIASRHQP